MINKLIYILIIGAAVILPGAFLFLLVWGYRKKREVSSWARVR